MEGRWREKREDADKAAVNRRRDVSAPLPSPLSRFPWFSNNKRQVYPRGDGRAGFLPPRQKILPCFFRGGIRGGEPEAFRSSPLNPTRLKRAIRNQAAVFLFARPTIKRLPSIEKRGIFAMEIESHVVQDFKVGVLLSPVPVLLRVNLSRDEENMNNFVWYNNHLREINFLNNGSK